VLIPFAVANERDRYKPKTPPPGVRAQTARSEDTAREIASLRQRLVELEGGVPEHEISDPEAATPVHIQRASTEVQKIYRAKRASDRLDAMRGEIGGMDTELLKQLLWSEIEDRREREERAATAHLERERAEMARDAEEAKAARELRATSAAARAKIIMTVIGIIGSGIIGYVGGRGGL
jgi:hypothetical protein